MTVKCTITIVSCGEKYKELDNTSQSEIANIVRNQIDNHINKMNFDVNAISLDILDNFYSIYSKSVKMYDFIDLIIMSVSEGRFIGVLVDPVNNWLTYFDKNGKIIIEFYFKYSRIENTNTINDLLW